MSALNEEVLIAMTRPEQLKRSTNHAYRILEAFTKAGIRDDKDTFVALFIVAAMFDSARPSYVQLGPERIGRLASGARLIVERATKEQGYGS